MSFMHILGGIVIGALIGRVFSIFTLRKVKGGKYTFSAVGVAGSLICDLCFKFLYGHGFVSSFYYKEVTIIFEMIGGALVACYILNYFGKKQAISFE